VETAPSAPHEMPLPKISHLVSGSWGGRPLKVHRGGTAGQLLSNADTYAAAVGQVIVLAPDAPLLKSSEGQRVLAHEVAHTVQQRG